MSKRSDCRGAGPSRRTGQAMHRSARPVLPCRAIRTRWCERSFRSRVPATSRRWGCASAQVVPSPCLDGPESPGVLVANETLARELFGGQPAVGRRVQIAGRDQAWEVIGVVEDIVYGGLDVTAEPGRSVLPTGSDRRPEVLRLQLKDIRHDPDDRRLAGSDSVSPRSRNGGEPAGDARPGDDDGGAAVDRDRTTARLRGFRRIVRGARAAPRRVRHLWPAQLHRGATPERDRDPDGAGRPPRRHTRARGQAGRSARDRGRRHRGVRPPLRRAAFWRAYCMASAPTTR